MATEVKTVTSMKNNVPETGTLFLDNDEFKFELEDIDAKIYKLTSCKNSQHLVYIHFDELNFSDATYTFPRNKLINKIYTNLDTDQFLNWHYECPNCLATYLIDDSECLTLDSSKLFFHTICPNCNWDIKLSNLHKLYQSK